MNGKHFFVWRVTYICVDVTQAQFLPTSSKHVSPGMRFLGLGIGGLSHQSCMSLHIGTNNIVGGSIIGSDNGLSPGRRQVIIWTNAGILLIGPLGINFSETCIHFHSRKCIWNFRPAAILSRPQCVNIVIRRFQIPSTGQNKFSNGCWATLPITFEYLHYFM